jgi:hypothetical protein
MGRGLSEQQKTGVRRIGDELMRQQARYDAADPETRKRIRFFGAKYCDAPEHSPSGWASWSRTLRRLQGRGLLVRTGYNGIWLTPAGWALYRELTGRDAPTVLLGWTGTDICPEPRQIGSYYQ